MYPIIDSKQVLNNIRLFEDGYKIYTVDLKSSSSNGNNYTYVIYPFEVAFYQYLIDRKKNNFTNESLTDYNLILFSGIINKLLSIIELENPDLVKSKIDSIFYIALRWLKDCTNELKLPEAFNFETSNLIVCKYCLKQFIKNKDNKFCGASSCLCNSTCSNDYTNFLNNEMVRCIIYSEIEVGLLFNAASRMIVNTQDLSYKEDLEKSRTYLKESIQGISSYFLKRLKKRYFLFFKENYRTYENISNINLMTSKTDHREVKLLAEYNEAYLQGNNEKIMDLLNGKTGDKEIDKLADFKKLRTIGKEASNKLKKRFKEKQV